MRILKLPAKILYYVSVEFNKICKNVFLCVSMQIAARISTGKSDMAIAHCWILMLVVVMVIMVMVMVLVVMVVVTVVVVVVVVKLLDIYNLPEAFVVTK